LPFSEQAFTDPALWEPWIGAPMPFMSAPDFPAEGFKEWIDSMIELGEMDPAIIVMPNSAANQFGFSMYTNSILNGGFEDYIVNDLVNFIDANYRTKDTKNGRALIGTSQGGYAAIKLGMLHPDKFCVVASHTGLLYIQGFLSEPDALFDENPGGEILPGPGKFFTNAVFAFGAAWSPNPNNPPYMVDLPFDEFGAIRPDILQKWLNHDTFSMLDDPQNLNNIRSLKGIYLDAGLQDELGMNGMADAFSTKLTAFGVTHTYENFQGTHFGDIFSRLEVSLPFCSEIMD
jgi:S-formylglutathione hydrolase FrmB